jgi:hypothetical protein
MGTTIKEEQEGFLLWRVIATRPPASVPLQNQFNQEKY